MIAWIRQDPAFAVRVIGLALLLLYLPLTALTYSLFRKRRRTTEINRTLDKLKISNAERRAYDVGSMEMGLHLLLAVGYSTAIAAFGLTVLMFGTELGLGAAACNVLPGGLSFPRQGWHIVTGMAVLGGYVWGMQYIFRRYTTNDLIPAVYQTLTVRMVLAAVVTLVVYNGYEALTGGAPPPTGVTDGTATGAEGASTTNVQGITAAIWPAFGFAMGMFPQRALNYLTSRVPMLSSEPDESKRCTPLEMIEGIELMDRMRLEELGIETCYDLAHADFVPLTLKTPYTPRQLVDWILQAKLCKFFGAEIRDLRDYSIRTILDLKETKSDHFAELASKTKLRLAALEFAKEAAKRDKEIPRLQEAAKLLGEYWNKDEDPREARSSA